MILVNPIIQPTVRNICCRPYPLHPKGCPNYGKRDTCPPKAPLFYDIYDSKYPVYAVINKFNLFNHVSKMRDKHPEWSDRQLRCVLYWQGTARKQLKNKVANALKDPRCDGYTATSCAEAMGVNLTSTLYHEGIYLEWPPVFIARQVVLLGKPL